MMNRRDFLRGGVVSGAAILPLSSGAVFADAEGAIGAVHLNAGNASAANLVALPARRPAASTAAEPWQNRVRRVGQTNMTEHDPAVMDIDAWADYWHSVHADVVFVSVTGILAFYPSRVPFHKHGRFLNGRDFFGECAAAAKKRGMRVVARMSPDLNWQDALEAHPEWAMRHKDGSAQFSGEEPRLFKTCMFSTYMDDYIPAIVREVNSTYEVDCFYANGWPPLGSLPECYCGVCSKLPAPGTPAYWRAFTDRVLSLWQRYDALAKEKRSDSFFFANSGGNVRGGPNLDRLGKTLAWFQADNQGRSYEDPSVWGCSLQGRVCNAVLDGKFAANVTAAYSTGNPGWRNLSKNPEEARMWLSQTSASGMVPYFHFVGAETGRGEDTRWQKTGVEYFDWTARHDAHLQAVRSIANIGLVIGQATQLLYPGPKTMQARSYMHETTQGIYEALLRGRFAFDFVHEDRLDPERLAKYRALLLPNVAMLSDHQCDQLRAYTIAGGSLMASFETSLYDENLEPRVDFALADLFGVHKGGEPIGTNGNPYYARIEPSHAQHAILEGFSGTNWLPGAQNRVPLKSVPDPLLTVVPGFVRYPPELAYPPVSHTDEPAVMLRESGQSRTTWLAGDVERTYWITGHGDLLRLLHNTIRWLTHDESPVRVEGEGFLEMFCWETRPGYAVHLLNYSNANAFHPWLQSVDRLGEQRISIRLPSGLGVKSVELLRAEQRIPHRFEDGVLQFAIPSVGDYEVAAITTT
jgi:hypothetical protein